MAGPLKGVRVIDMTRVIAGPTAGQTLADLGAEVVKVERRGEGDDVRTLGPPWLPDEQGEPTGESTYFQAVNRGKLSLQLDFARPEGAAIIRRMAAKADVLLENFRPGTLAKYGLGHADLAAINPGIVVASITGFGQTGPYADRSGYDLLVQAMAGLMQATGLPDGEPGGGPMRVGVPLADMMAGQNAVVGVLAALRHRDATGIGQHVDIALFDSQLAMMLQHSAAWLNTRTKIPRSGNQHLSSIPYGVFQASDGPVLIVTSTDREWVRLSRALGHPEWAGDPRFLRSRDRAANREEVTRLVGEALRGMKRQAAIEAMLAEKIPAGPINDMEDVEADPQVAARGMIVTLPRADGRRVRMIGSPLKLSATPVEYGGAPPMAGEHTDRVLADWAGMSAAEIAEAHRSELV